MAVALDRRKFTADEFERMAEVGILAPDERVELLDGDVVLMSPTEPAHDRCLQHLVARFRRLGDAAVSGGQDPIRLDERWVPHPDLALLRPGTRRMGHLQPDDVLLVVEVSVGSIAVERDDKADRYGMAGIPETWMLDIEAAQLSVHREPSRFGYRLVRNSWWGDRAQPLFEPEFDVYLDAILGPTSDSAGTDTE